jgi:hypothetical protein
MVFRRNNNNNTLFMKVSYLWLEQLGKLKLLSVDLTKIQYYRDGDEPFFCINVD